MMAEQVRVLIIEDNPIDVLLVKKALAAAERCEFRVIDNGHDAFEFLNRSGAGLRPHLIILDLNLPGRNGREILDLIREKPDLQNIAVAVVSSSPDDILKQHAEQANCCVSKPFHLEDFGAKARTILDCYRASQHP
jgi:chemotaxis family two-component system response regulator Rcp1